MAACLSHAVSSVLPEPHFEGSEKRVEVDFLVPEGSDGLRALSRQQLDELMSLAHCCIVSSRSNACFDAYVLSESSLFVYPRKWVLKTCGTTRLLDSLPRLLELTGEMGLVATRAVPVLRPEVVHRCGRCARALAACGAFAVLGCAAGSKTRG